MENSKPIVKPNHVSTARINLTALQKNIVYLIIDELQKSMTKDLNAKYEQQRITVLLKELDPNNHNNYTRVRQAARDLISKLFDYDIVIPKSGKITRTDTVILSGISHVLHSKNITFIIPAEACFFFCYIGGGFTSFQKTIAISLNSLYSKIMYEFCCRWIDRGGYQCTIDFFKEKLNISNKYNQVSHLRNKVLEPSKKELINKADVYFLYSLTKEGRKFTHISFKILKNTNDSSDRFNGVRQEHFSFIYNFLSIYFPREVNTNAQFYTDIIIQKGNATQAYERFKRLDDEYCNGSKSKKDITNLLNKVILKEMGVEKNEKTPKTKSGVIKTKV